MNSQGTLSFDFPTDEPTETLAEINAEMLERARAVPSLRDRVFIFGEGPLAPRVAVVGESPGPPDIESGRPFMGPTGQMLERILGSIGLKRRDCYLTNAVKIVSTGDEITPDILHFFTPYLHRELDVVRPRLIIAFGNTPTRALLGTKKAISQVRGDFFSCRGMTVLPTFNPAYLLRDPSKKREAWEDMKRARAFLNSLQ
ncbi:MAG: uracil-DNA glycosylase [Pyrinomonas sp.]|uniref:uracil-DNA glycosylase n=1 Tax=Pyrinomonas sp. TaxID=2080306 RepID=UPI0033295F21